MEKSIQKSLTDAGLNDRDVVPFMRVRVVGLTSRNYHGKGRPKEGVITICNPIEKQMDERIAAYRRVEKEHIQSLDELLDILKKGAVVRRRFKKLLVAFDGSKASVASLHWILDHRAEDLREAEFHVVLLLIPTPKIEKVLSKVDGLVKAFERLCAALEITPIVRTPLSEDTDVASVLCKIIRDGSYDLLIMTKTGMGRQLGEEGTASRTMLGCVDGATCPVIVLNDNCGGESPAMESAAMESAAWESAWESAAME